MSCATTSARSSARPPVSEIEADFRLAAVDAVVDTATVEVPAEILEARATERWERVERQIQAQGMDPAAYLQMQGKAARRSSTSQSPTPSAS